MDSTSNKELINTAQGVLNPHTVGGRLFGNVASVLITATGNCFSGVCIDTVSGTGFCAEHSAIAAMVTAGEYQIAKIVAVWRDGDGLLYVYRRADVAASSSDGAGRTPRGGVPRVSV